MTVLSGSFVASLWIHKKKNFYYRLLLVRPNTSLPGKLVLIFSTFKAVCSWQSVFGRCMRVAERHTNCYLAR